MRLTNEDWNTKLVVQRFKSIDPDTHYYIYRPRNQKTLKKLMKIDSTLAGWRFKSDLPKGTIIVNDDDEYLLEGNINVQ